MKTKAGPLSPVTYLTVWWGCRVCGAHYGTRVAQTDMTAKDREMVYEFKYACEKCPNSRWLDQKVERLFK